MKEQRSGAPIFVKIDEYKDILDVLDMIKGRIKEMRNTLTDINSLRNDENAEIVAWTSTLNDIEKKIEDLDKMMFEPEHAW